MPKRPLSVQNQDQEQTSTIVTRSGSKRSSTNDPNPPKKSKQNDENKENLDTEPIAESDAATDEGTIHPTNKQYLVYKTSNSKQDDFIISKTARYWTLKYRKDLYHCCPDVYGMYIHNDFSGYGQLEVIENCLLDLTKTIFLRQEGLLRFSRKAPDDINYVLAFRRLETLTILLEYADEYPNVDDGERVYGIQRVIAACYVTILRGLLPTIMFEKLDKFDEILVKKLKRVSRQIPNFKQVLELALLLGYQYVTTADLFSAYTKVLQVLKIPMQFF